MGSTAARQYFLIFAYLDVGFFDAVLYILLYSITAHDLVFPFPWQRQAVRLKMYCASKKNNEFNAMLEHKQLEATLELEWLGRGER